MTGLSNSGGLGWGGIVSPLMILLFDIKTNYAINIAYIFVFWGGLGNFL